VSTDIGRLDVDLQELKRRIARARFAARMQRLDDLRAHPEYAATGKHATPGEAAEYRHLLYDADTDATVPAFPYPTPLETP
jgi:hypothetical protein